MEEGIRLIHAHRLDLIVIGSQEEGKIAGKRLSAVLRELVGDEGYDRSLVAVYQRTQSGLLLFHRDLDVRREERILGRSGFVLFAHSVSLRIKMSQRPECTNIGSPGDNTKNGRIIVM